LAGNEFDCKDGSMSGLARSRLAAWSEAVRVRLQCVLFAVAIGAALIGSAGCGKNARDAAPVALNGVNIDLPKLQQSCNSSDPAVQESVDKVRLSIRYADYRTALAELGKLAKNPDFSETQKKTINEIGEQVKRAFENASPSSTSSSVQ